MWTVSLSESERDRFLKLTKTKSLTEAVRKVIATQERRQSPTA